MLRRRTMLAALAAGAGGAVVTGLSVHSSPARGRAMRMRGADLSSLAQVERAGRTFTDGGRERPVEVIMADHGATHARLRLWVSPPVGTSDLPSVLGLAARAAAAGLKVFLDVHYSDTWADPSHQTTPAAWQGQSLDALSDTVRGYTRSVIEAFARQGTTVDVIQIGNEVTNGMLWPIGQVYSAGQQQWSPFTQLLSAGMDGVHAAGGVRETVVHIDAGGNNAVCRHFFDQLQSARVGFDTLALSYYPFWNGSLNLLSANMHDLAQRYGKDVVVAETAYPWTLSSPGIASDMLSTREQLPDVGAFPPDPTGQRAYYESLRSVMADTPDGHGAGFMVWEPAWPAGVELAVGAGNPYDNLGLFDSNDATLPAIDCVRPLPAR
jgi:arabinogalactan endo-1,4-beta-galactosidase